MPRAHKVTSSRRSSKPSSGKRRPTSILVIDIGGSKVKILATGQTEPRKIRSGTSLTPARMVERVQELARDWDYDAVSIGYPGRTGDNGPSAEPGNLKPGWVGFNFAAAFDRPVRVINDAAMQALGSYDGGRMLFLGLGTGLGATLIAEKVLIPLELGELPYRGGALWQVLGRRGLEKLGRPAWCLAVDEIVPMFMNAFLADYIVLGGGNAKKVKRLPPGVRLGHNQTAFVGGFRLWNVEDVATLSADGKHHGLVPEPVDWRVL